jgi:hypothetical protein
MKDVTRAGSEDQNIPLPKGMTRNVLVQRKQYYISVRSFTDSFDPDSYGSGFGHQFSGSANMTGYIVLIHNYLLPKRRIKLDDLVQAIDDFLPDAGDTYDDDEAVFPNTTMEEHISSEQFYDPRTNLVSPPNSARSF